MLQIYFGAPDEFFSFSNHANDLVDPKLTLKVLLMTNIKLVS